MICCLSLSLSLSLVFFTQTKSDLPPPQPTEVKLPKDGSFGKILKLYLKKKKIALIEAKTHSLKKFFQRVPL